MKMAKQLNKFNAPSVSVIESSTPRPTKPPSFPRGFSPFPVKIESPMLSPIRSNTANHMLLQSQQQQKGGKNGMDLSFSPIFDSFNTSSNAAILDERLGVDSVLKQYSLAHLSPVFISKGITLDQLVSMKERDFVELGIFKLNELYNLKKICALFTEHNSSF